MLCFFKNCPSVSCVSFCNIRVSSSNISSFLDVRVLLHLVFVHLGLSVNSDLSFRNAKYTLFFFMLAPFSLLVNMCLSFRLFFPMYVVILTGQASL